MGIIEDVNYYNDHRVRARDRWYRAFDKARMVATVEIYGEDDESEWTEEAEIPCVYVVCGTCDGKGTHVNPSIDASGIGPEGFHEDPDFADDYLRGRFDVRCYGCGGDRVIPTPDQDRCDPAVLRAIEERERAMWEMHQEEMAERRMGA